MLERTHRVRAFTLIEILIVLCIIVVLASLLFAAFTRVRANGDRTFCQGNLKQIALAMQQYTQDYAGRYPFWYGVEEPSSTVVGPPPGAKGMGWAQTLQPYLQSTGLFQCPGEGDTFASPTLPAAFGYTDYAYNINLSGEPESRFVSPTHTVVHSEWGSYGAWNWNRGPENSVVVGIAGGRRHLDGGNYTFADGHVKWLKPEMVEGGYQGPVSSTCNTPSDTNITFCFR